VLSQQDISCANDSRLRTLDTLNRTRHTKHVTCRNRNRLHSYGSQSNTVFTLPRVHSDGSRITEFPEMLTMSEANTQTRAPSAMPGNGLRVYWYLLPLILGPLLFLLTAFLVLPTRWFAYHSRDIWLESIGYGDKLQDVNCQILVYGDSTAEVGVDPAVIERSTGLKTCNIAQPEGLNLLSQNIVLDRYLSHNASPRFLIFLFAAEDFNPAAARKDHGLFEAITYRMRDHDRLSVLLQLMRHPEDYFRWSYVGLHMMLDGFLREREAHDSEDVRERRKGQLKIEELLMTKCTDSNRVSPPDKNWAAALRSRYARPNMTILVDAMPLPSCDPGILKVQQQMQRVTDAPVQQLPASVFYSDGSHVNAAGSALLSEMLSQQVLQRIQWRPMEAGQ
jgi:hypothetical protein